MVVDSGTEALDESEVPQEVRFLLVTPATYRVIKKSKDIAMETDIGHDMKIKGIIAEYKIHEDPPGISGDLIEGRVYYDAFVPKNKKKALYYQKKLSE